MRDVCFWKIKKACAVLIPALMLIFTGCSGTDAAATNADVGTAEAGESTDSDDAAAEAGESSDAGDADDGTVSYVEYSTEFGLRYELPDYWFNSIESTDTEVYNYRNSVLDLDGSMTITFISFDDLDGTDLDGLADLMAESVGSGEAGGSVEKSAFTAENTEGVALHAEDIEANYGTARIDMYFIECADGIAMISFNQLMDSDYDEEFGRILDSVSVE